MYKNFDKPSDNMLISDREADRMFYESQQEYFRKQKEAEDRKRIAIENQINEQNEYFLNRELEMDEYINKRNSFIESVKNSLLSECLMKIYKDSSVAPLTESDKVIVNKLINNFIIENGADNLLDNFATKNLLLSEVNRITNKYYNAIIEKCDECNDDKGKEFIIDKTIKDEFLDELKDLDTIDASKLIKDRVADAITEFINSNEDNFKREILLGIIALVLSYLFKIDKIEFIIIIIVIGLVLVSEIINTAIERLVDLVSPKYNKLAGEVKDIAASSVLLMCIFSLVVGVIIFVPKIINLLGGF